MNISTSAMIDLIFEVEEGTLSNDYPFTLWSALVERVPSLAVSKNIGILPLRPLENSEGVPLPKRSKLTIRLPSILADYATCLSGQQLLMPGSHLHLGAWKTRKFKYYPTLHAQLVTGASDELQFTNHINTQLTERGITGKMICGKRHTLTGKLHCIHGYSLVLHDLTPEASLQLQQTGLGDARQFGCGIFVPYKVISGLE